MSERRLQNELKIIKDNPVEFCTVELDGDDIFTWNGKFDDDAKFQIKFHKDHPYSPPKILINDKPFCYNQFDWSPAINVEGLISNIYVLHRDPRLKRRECRVH